MFSATITTTTTTGKKKISAQNTQSIPIIQHPKLRKENTSSSKQNLDPLLSVQLLLLLFTNNTSERNGY
jgi:hypothetical protein